LTLESKTSKLSPEYSPLEQFRGDLVRLTATLSEMIDYDLDMPVIVKVDNITRMSFAEIPKFTVDIKSFSASSSGEYSGDSFVPAALYQESQKIPPSP